MKTLTEIVMEKVDLLQYENPNVREDAYNKGVRDSMEYVKSLAQALEKAECVMDSAAIRLTYFTTLPGDEYVAFRDHAQPAFDKLEAALAEIQKLKAEMEGK